MMAGTCVSFFLFFLNVVTAGDVDYLSDLITEARENALRYDLPKSATEYESPPEQHYYGDFDYIIIGAGSAGSVMANRLAEKKDWKILVIEAGNFENNFTDIPAMRYANEFTAYNWGYRSTPQTYSYLGMVNRTCSIPRGKGVGGTTLLNGLIYSRPNPHDFERWEAVGNSDWSYEDVLPYFKKSEKTHIANGDVGYHGRDGYLNVEYRSPQSPHLKAFLEANVELDQHIVDYNGKQQLGVSQTQYNTIYGARQSNGKAFINPVLQEENLWLLLNAYVTKIIIDQNRYAKGVEFSHNHTRFAAFADKEVILAAGAISSPQILQLSGIGPEELLENFDIPVIANLPVGKHLTDQPTFYGLYFETTYSEPVRSLKSYVAEYLQGFGPLTMPGNNQGIGFYRTSLARFKHSPDLELTIITANSSDEFIPKVLNLGKETSKALFSDSDPTRQFCILTTLLQPVSEGSVEIQSEDPFEYPRIHTNFLANRYDVDSMYAAIEFVFELINTQTFKDLNTQYSTKPLPECRGHTFLSKAYWYCTIRQLTMGSGNLGGTCRMGPHQENAVVDNKFRVHGINSLRVVDASVFPFPLSSNYNAMVTALAERASEFIIEDLNVMNSDEAKS